MAATQLPTSFGASAFGAPLEGGEVGLPTITPHQIALCYLVKGYLSPGDHDPGGTWLQRQALGDALLRAMRRAEDLREPGMEALIATIQSEVDVNLQPASTEADLLYSRQVGASVRHHMGAVRSVDALTVLFSGLAHMVTTSTNLRAEESVGADDNSVMGFFLRRCWCDFTALPFEASCALVAACRRYVSEADLPRSTLKTRVGVERFLAATSARMERQAGAAPRAALEAAAADAEAAAPRLPAVQGARAVGARLHADAAAVVGRLHHRFDRPLDPEVPSVAVVAAGDVPPPYIIGGLPGGRTHAPRLQGAALAQGMAHARLGEVGSALAALNEAMRAAQQAGDSDTLCHALAGLCQVLGDATPGSVAQQLPRRPGVGPAEAHALELARMLRRLLARAEALGLPHLAAYARLAAARARLLDPPAPAPRHPEDADAPPAPSAAAVDTSAAARYVGHLHLAAALAAAVPVAPPANSGFACLRILRGLGDMFAPLPDVFSAGLLGARGAAAGEVGALAAAAPLLRAAGWGVFGGGRVGLAHTLAFLDVHGATARAEEACTAWAQAATAVAAAHGPGAGRLVLALAARRFPRSQSRALAAARWTVAHEAALHHHDLPRAMALATRLAGLATPGDATAAGWRLDGEERIVRTQLAGNLHAEAARGAAALAAAAAAARQPLAATRAALLAARARVAAGAAAAAGAVPYLLRVLRQAQDMHADLLAAEAAVLLAQAWSGEGPARRREARRAAEGALPLILAHGPVELRQRARQALAEIVMAGCSTKEEILGESEWLLGLLRDAQNDCAALEDWRRSRAVAHLSALLLDVRGSTGARDAVAAEYVRKGEAKAKAFAGLPEFPTSTAPDAPPEAQPEVEMQLAAEPPPEAQPQLEAPKERRSSGRKVRGKRGA